MDDPRQPWQADPEAWKEREAADESAEWASWPEELAGPEYWLFKLHGWRE